MLKKLKHEQIDWNRVHVAPDSTTTETVKCYFLIWFKHDTGVLKSLRVQGQNQEG